MVGLLAAAYFLVPMYWTVVVSLRTEADNVATPVSLVVGNPTLDNYRAVLATGRFVDSLVSSFVIGALTTVASLAVGSLAAYALSRLRVPFKRSMLIAFLAMTVFPSISLLTGLYAINDRVRTFDAGAQWIAIPTESVLAVLYMIFALPLAVWLLTNLFSEVPEELMESARVDGASPMQAFTHILLPLAVPALVSVGMLVFIAAWQEYLFALTLTTLDPDVSTMPVAITDYARLGTPVGRVMAATVIASVPMVVITAVFQRQIVTGLTAGSVKG